jgi:1-acyl-sn-glycerol-3-phosphate acyltransferase
VGESESEREYGKLYPVAKAVLSPLFKGLWRIKTVGLDRLPPNGGAIFCPNHTSVIDSFFLPLVLPRRITFVGKAEYMDSWKTKHIFPAIGMIPIDRSGGNAAERALNTAARVLESGEFFGIYPEGTRARDGRLHRGHTGPARLALRTGAPIVPVGIVGTREIQPELIPGAIDECLRYETPGQFIARVASEEFQIHDQTIKKHQAVFLLLGSANRDAAKFTEPDRLDVRRENSGQHLGFGKGAHACVGAHLVKQQLQAALRVVLQELPGIRRKEEPLHWRVRLAHRWLQEFPIRFDR